MRAVSPCTELPASSSSQSYLLQVLRTALILAHIQVHKADLEKWANGVKEVENLAGLFEESRNQLGANEWRVVHILYQRSGIETGILPLSCHVHL